VLRVQLLGQVRAWQGQKELDLGSPQQRVVFGLLAARPGLSVCLEELVDALWPQQPPAAAANVVQTYVKRLRRLLEPGRAPRAPSVVLTTGPGGYRLRVDSLDVAEFRAEVDRAEACASPAARAALLGTALARWHGQPFCGTRLADSPLAHALTAERDRALHRYADAAMSAGRPEDACPVLEQMARQAPLDEGLHATLMRVLHAAGRRSAAFETYLAIRGRLIDELGVDPGPELVAAHGELLAPGRAVGPVLTRSVAGPATGWYRRVAGTGPGRRRRRRGER